MFKSISDKEAARIAIKDAPHLDEHYLVHVCEGMPRNEEWARWAVEVEPGVFLIPSCALGWIARFRNKLGALWQAAKDYADWDGESLDDLGEQAFGNREFCEGFASEHLGISRDTAGWIMYANDEAGVTSRKKEVDRVIEGTPIEG